MSYIIQVFDFNAPVADSEPVFASQKNISFADAVESRIYLDDADNRFEPTTANGEPGQRLLIDTELGGTVLNAGTVLTYPSRTALCVISLSGTSYNYLVFFPYKGASSINSPTLVGDKSTVMVIPTQTSTPPLDPTKLYDYLRVQTSSSGFSVAETPIPDSYLNPTCFATGTLIDTASGPRPVEALIAGDLVLTRDGGVRPVAWTGGRHLDARQLDIAPNLRPIRIRAGALGPGLPASDLIVSPQHRVLVQSKIAERICGTPEALVAARHLCALPGVEVTNPSGGIGYHHILFDRHEIVRSNGTWTELLFTGPQALASLGPAARREIRAIFPELFGHDAIGRVGAREFLTGAQARELTRRHLKNDKSLIA